MKKLLKISTLLLCALLLVQCGPSWKDADKKLEEGDEKGAALILTELADKGDEDAMRWLANYYSDRLVISPDSVTMEQLTQAEPWLLATAKDESSSGNVGWALYVIYSQSPNLKNESEALKWAQSASRKGNLAASFVVGEHLYNSKKYSEAIPILSKVADEKDPLNSQKQYVRDAAMYLYEIFTDSDSNNIDLQKAVRYGDKAASLGHPDAQYYMAYRYTYGDGVKEDIEKAYNYMTARNGGLPDKKLEENIKSLYNAEMKVRESQRAMQKLKDIEETFSNSGWIKNEGDGKNTMIFLGANNQIIIRFNDAYASSVSGTFRYQLDKSSLDNFAPRIQISKVLDVEGTSYSWGQDFLGNTYTFSIEGNSMTVSGPLLSGTYRKR